MPLTVELLDSPADGQLDLIDGGLWEYTPGSGFAGSDAFSYRLFDGTAHSLPALVTFEQQPAAPTVTDVTEAWLAGFEDEALGSVTVAVFESAEADVLDWTAGIDWGDGTTTTGQIVADGGGRFRVLGEHTYDEWGLYLVRVTLTDTAEATHDLLNLASIQFRSYTDTFTDPIGNSTQFVFAEGWQLTQEIDPLGNSTFYSYTSDGLLASRTDRLGRTITFDYDSDGVLLSQTWLAADGLTVADTLAFTYTSDGLLQSASNGVGAYTFTWDDGVLTGVTNPFGVTLTFGYDADGRRTSVADSFGGLITSTYTDGLLASRTLTAGALNLRVDLGYDADGVPTQISRFAGPLRELVSQTEYAFAQGLLASITHRGAGGVILDQFLYQFDEDGFLSQIASNFTGETDYSYDTDGQLTGESSPLVSNTFSYDANGNRVGDGYVVGPGNRLLADGTWTYSYDAEGNLIGKTHLATGDSWSYSYDHRNQMTLAEKRDATGAVVLHAAYKYDVFGNRIEKSVDWDGDGPNAAVVTRYVLDGWNNLKPTPIGNEHFDVVAELDGTNQLIARYLHGDEFDQTFARVRVDGSTPEVHWLLTDHLNSVRLVLDESGAVLDQIAYDAFGNIIAQLNPLLANPILFASREFDAETGLYYNRARYLDPSTGRWTTQDPLGFAAGDANLYRYVGNMAMMATDPSGNIFFVPLLVYGGIALAGVGTAGLLYSAHRYDYAREHYLSRPIHQWTPELQAEYRAYVRTTDWIAAGSEVTGWTGVSMVAAPYMGYWGGYAWTAGGTGGRLIVGGAGLGGLGYTGYDGYTIYRDWRLMEGPEQFRRVGNLAGPTLVGLGTGPRYFQLGAAVGRLPGRVPTRVDPWGRWAVMVDGDRHQTLLFHPRYASPFAPGPLGPGRDSYITAAIVMPDGRVVVLEGMHRLVGAQSGAIIPEHLGGIGGWPWWLHYDLFIRPPH